MNEEKTDDAKQRNEVQSEERLSSDSQGSIAAASDGQAAAASVCPAEVECAICFKLLVRPTTTACGHTFCELCLRLARQANPVCPLCREPLQFGRRPNVALMNLIMREYPRLYEERIKELAADMDESFQDRNRPSRGIPVIQLAPHDQAVMNKFAYKFPGDSVIFATNDEELIAKLRLTRSLGEKIGVTVPSPASLETATQSASTSSAPSSEFGLIIHMEGLHMRVNEHQNEALVQFKVIERWEKTLAEADNNNLDYEVVYPFYDKGIDFDADGDSTPRRREFIERYCHLSNQLNEELQKQFQLSGIAGINKFRQLYGNLPDASEQNLTADKIEETSFFYARVFRLPLSLRGRLFYLRNSLERMEQVLAHVRARSGPYSLLRLAEDEGESFISYSTRLDSLLNNVVLISSVAVLCWLIAQNVVPGSSPAYQLSSLLLESPLCLLGMICLIIYLVKKGKAAWDSRSVASPS